MSIKEIVFWGANTYGMPFGGGGPSMQLVKKQAWFKKGRIWVTKWKGGYHTKSCKTLLFESITHYNFNPYVKKSDLQSLCKTVVWNLLLQNAPPLLLPTIEPYLFSSNFHRRPPPVKT